MHKAAAAVKVSAVAQQGLTVAQTALLAAVVSAVAVLTVGILNVWAQTKQRHEQATLLERQLAAQREQADRQLGAQREQSGNELAEQRALRILELREQAARLLRTEKSAAYAKALYSIRSERANWGRMASLPSDVLIHELPALSEEVQRDREATRYSAAELELVSSESVYGALLAFQASTEGLLATFVQKSETLIAQQGAASRDTLSGAQRALREEMEAKSVTRLYDALLTEMRRELFDLALDQPLRPSVKDQDQLRAEVQRLREQLPKSNTPLDG